MTEKTIGPKSKILMHYTLRLEDDSVADSSLDGDKPSYLEMGEGNISDTFEKQLMGMKVGEEKRVKLKAVDAFGEPKPEMIYHVPREKFDDLGDVEVGSIVEFEQPNGELLPGIVRKIDDGLVLVDFNHPLAGRNVAFDVRIVDIDPE